MKNRINISLDSEFSDALDRVVLQLGTNRSEFLTRCALLVMTREQHVVPPMPRTVDAGAKQYLDSRFPRSAG